MRVFHRYVVLNVPKSKSFRNVYGIRDELQEGLERKLYKPPKKKVTHLFTLPKCFPR